MPWKANSMAEKVAPGVFSERNYRAGRWYATNADARDRMGHADHGLLEGGSDPAFLHTDPWRALRIQAEFVEGFDVLAELGRAVTVFGRARLGGDHPQYELARASARPLARRGLRGDHRRRPGDHGGGQQGRAARLAASRWAWASSCPASRA